jgi:hypothetical protein
MDPGDKEGGGPGTEVEVEVEVEMNEMEMESLLVTNNLRGTDFKCFTCARR